MTSAVAMANSVFGWEGVGRALADAQLAHSLEPRGSRWRPMAAWLVADRHIWNDDWDDAQPYLQEVVESPPIHRAVRALAFSMLALWHLDRDDVEHAVVASDRACTRSSRRPPSASSSRLLRCIRSVAASRWPMATGQQPKRVCRQLGCLTLRFSTRSFQEDYFILTVVIKSRKAKPRIIFHLGLIQL